MQLSPVDSRGMVPLAYRWSQMATSQFASPRDIQTTVSESQNCLSAITSEQENSAVEGPKTQAFLRVSHGVPSLSTYWFLGVPSFNTQLPLFMMQGARVSARGSEDLHRDIASLGGIFNGLVCQTAAIITRLSSFH